MRQQLFKLLLIPFVLLLLPSCTAKKDETVSAVEPPEVATTEVVSRKLERGMNLPGEILAYQDVPIYPKVSGFIDWIGVDRGSRVKKGQLLVRLIAPELEAQEHEANAKVSEAETRLAEVNRRFEQVQAQKLESQAKLDADALTFKRLKEASETPGVIAQNDVDVLEKTVEADRQAVTARQQIIKATTAEIGTAKNAVKAARQAEKNVADMKAYLNITAPFDGMITERNMHDGSLAYPPSGANGYAPMLRIRELSLLRIVIPVPEIAVSDVKDGTPIDFTVSAYPGRVFMGKVARISHALDIKTRTMPIELNYWNTDDVLEPGMFPDVRWPMKRAYDTMFVPTTAVAVTLEKPFVARLRDGKLQWVYIKTGQTMGDMIEVFGDLQPGDQVAIRGTDEIADGTTCRSKLASKI
jgi:membrane fusion protein (multidrug efflux system)